MRVVWSAVLLLSLVTVWSVKSFADSMDRIVAVVNGDIILYSELQERVRVVNMVSPESKSSDPARKAQLEKDLLQQMVREKLSEQEAKRMKIIVTKRDVDDAVEGMKQDNHVTDAQIEASLKQNGQKMEEFRESLRKDIERNRLIDRALKSKIVISEQQVDAFLRQSGAQLPAKSPLKSPVPPPDEAGGKEKYRLGIIFIPDAGGSQAKESEKQAKDILEKLSGGADFAKMAKDHSKGPAADEGGDVGFLAMEEITPALQKAVGGLGKGQLTGVTKGPNGYYIVKVLDIQKDRPPAPVTETRGTGEVSLREQARRQLYQQEMNRRFDEWVRDLESRSFIKISL